MYICGGCGVRYSAHIAQSECPCCGFNPRYAERLKRLEQELIWFLENQKKSPSYDSDLIDPDFLKNDRNDGGSFESWFKPIEDYVSKTIMDGQQRH